MSDRFDKYDDDEVREIVLAFEASRNGEGRRYFDVDEMEIVIDYYLDQNDIEHLDTAVRYAESLFPESNSIRLRRAHLLCAKGLYDRALPLLKNLQRLEPENADVHYALGAVYDTMGQPQKAIRHYLVAARDNYALDMIYGNIGDEYRALLDDENAISYYKKALSINHDEVRSIQNLCYTYTTTQRLDEGEAYFSDFVTRHPYSTDGWFALAMIYSGLSLYEKAIDAAEYALAIDKQFIEAYMCVANCYVELQRPSDAASTLLEALKYSEAPEEIYHAIGTIFWSNNNISTAIAYFQKAIEIDPFMSDSLHYLAKCYAYQGDPHTAIVYIERAIASIAEVAEYHFDAARIYTTVDDVEQAKQHFQKTLDIDNNEDIYWTAYADFLYNHKEYQSVIDLLESGLPTANDAKYFYAYIAACHYRLGHTQQFHQMVDSYRNEWPDWINSLLTLCPEADIAIHPNNLQ